MKKKKFFQIKGFTLIELLVVISIISVLSSVVFAPLTDARSKAKDSKRIQIAGEYIKAIELARFDNGAYPRSSGGWSGCLGGDLYSDARCGPVDSYPSYAGIDGVLELYFPSLPIMEGNIYYNPGIPALYFEGFSYICPADPCVAPVIEYMLERDGAQCGPGVGVISGTKTFCAYTFD